MATYPFKVYGGCVSTVQYVLKVKFDQPLSSVPSVRAYDNDQTFPSTGNLTSTNFKIFTGTSGNGNKSMLHFIDTTRGGPPSTSWYVNATTGVGGFATVRMKGDTSYLQFNYSVASVNQSGGGSLYWNALIKTPYDVNPTMTRLHDIAFRYTFTSTIPNITFYANNEHAGGNSVSPAWGTITPNSQGIRFGSATATNSSILGNIPISGEEVSETLWVADS